MTDEMHRLHCSKKSTTFSPEEEANSLNNVMGKNRIIFVRAEMYVTYSIIIVICSLLAGINCAANKSNFD